MPTMHQMISNHCRDLLNSYKTCTYWWPMMKNHFVPCCTAQFTPDSDEPHFWLISSNLRKKKRPERRKHCALAVVRRSQSFLPCHRTLPGAYGGQNLISWRWSLPLPTNPVWWGSMHAILSYRGNRPTNTHKQTHRQDRLQYTVPLSLACSVNM